MKAGGKRSLTGKSVSLALMILGAMFICVMSVLNGICKWGYSLLEISAAGGAIAALGGTISASKIITNVQAGKSRDDSGAGIPRS